MSFQQGSVECGPAHRPTVHLRATNKTSAFNGRRDFIARLSEARSTCNGTVSNDSASDVGHQVTPSSIAIY